MEESEDQFDSCWKCGTRRDGSPPESDFGIVPLPDATELDPDQSFAKHFKCCKCAHTKARVKRIAATGTGLSKLMDIQHNTFIAVSCEYCGFTELFNPDVFKGKRYLGTIIDILFG
jgi:predicted nucleic-acid-binding Zn-ribbon protein